MTNNTETDRYDDIQIRAAVAAALCRRAFTQQRS
jgi:hypothetical protein